MPEPQVDNQTLPGSYLFTQAELARIKEILEDPLIRSYISTMANDCFSEVIEEKYLRPGNQGWKDSFDIKADF